MAWERYRDARFRVSLCGIPRVYDELDKMERVLSTVETLWVGRRLQAISNDEPRSCHTFSQSVSTCASLSVFERLWSLRITSAA